MIFQILLLVCFLSAGASAGSGSVTCSSQNYKPKTCTIQTKEVLVELKVDRRYSRSPCIKGISFKIGGDKRSVEVKSGCRARFAYKTRPVVKCESWQFKRATCRVPLANSKLLKKLKVALKASRSACTDKKSFGIAKDQRSMWVDKGCRAEFFYDTKPRPVKSGGNRVRCESWGYRYKRCRVGKPLASVKVFKKHSRSACTFGSSFGIEKDIKYMFVNKGCRADFTYKYYDP